jgi:Holliday junction resolvase RusA-like endonuclease
MTSQGRPYTPAATKAAEQVVQQAWMYAGRHTVGDQPASVEITVWTGRPKTHYRKNGGLSAAGLRSVSPSRKPDLDNVVKLVCDALNGLAWDDDAQVCSVVAKRHWCDPHEARVVVFVEGFQEEVA